MAGAAAAVRDGGETRRLLGGHRDRLSGPGKRSVVTEPGFDPFSSGNEEATRAWVASLVLRGSGLDIGPLHRPMIVPSSVRVTYVDRMTAPELRSHYPELAHFAIVEPDL